MRPALIFLQAILLFPAVAIAATHADKPKPLPTPEQRQTLIKAHAGDFDYLLGDWEFSAENQQYGKFRGYWSATRLPGGQILDEYRVVGDKAETYYVTTTVRAYNAGLDRWELIGMDGAGGLQDFGTGQRVDGGMQIEQRFGVSGPHPSLWRIRYRDIRPDAFSWSADRSLDDGKQWTTDFQKLEARRIGPPRVMDALTPPAKKTSAP